MSWVLVQDVKEESVARLLARATVHGWSLQSEVKAILEAAAAGPDAKALKGWSQNLPAPQDGSEDDSVTLLLRYMEENQR